ncbi:hypothetical protein [Ligilactobacillus ruminis]|uniref:hypothetical protein n=1 Tax=Ligilactobacillus ruminis TaxID=1623 RepID=UPI0022E98D42|nr:hypothetical protein [Ligilactobacillus ruminis]
MIEQMMCSTAFGKITVVYGHIDEMGALSVKYVLVTDKQAKNGTLSVNLNEILACRPE